MVAQFGRDHYHFSEDEIQLLTNQVREGDLSSVLKAYEDAIKVSESNIEKYLLLKSNLIILTFRALLKMPFEETLFVLSLFRFKKQKSM
jgi:hypothetical protein